jgi:endogenous inhibitor of DNA gyrase (YacG/DUF329 family)
MNKINMATTVYVVKCPICSRPGNIRSIEFLPKSGVAMECMHKDGLKHEWAEYNSMEAVEKKNQTKPRNPKMIKCPKCGKRGIVNQYTPDKKRPDRVVYYFRHGKITYGKTRKQDRCYITKEYQRASILKKLGLYIPPISSLEKFL